MRLPVERVECVVWGKLSSDERTRLADDVYALWNEIAAGMSKSDWVQRHLFDDTRLVMGFGETGELAGFANINSYTLGAGPREHLVLTSGLFYRLKYQSSRSLQFQCVREALEIMAAHPGRPMAGVAVATSPLAYDLAARMLPRVYPHPRLEPPPHVLPLLHELAQKRNLPIDPANPWAAQFPVHVADAKAVEQSRSYRRGSPFISWYCEQVPNWAEGQALPLWVPIDFKNVVGVFWNLLRHGARRAR
ncbi:MAG: hypothetical protein IPM54_30785 [Polyangiaceae bacterium]|nr:hypothetical protein [Polyangiaceae bacterium]